MKFASVLALGVAVLGLAGCHPALTLEEAQAQCTKQGGLLVVIYTQKFTRTSMGPVVASPGDCVSPDRFLKKDADVQKDSPTAKPASPPENSSRPENSAVSGP